MKQLLEAELLGLGNIQVELVDFLRDLQQDVAVSTPAGVIRPDSLLATVTTEDGYGSQDTVATTSSAETGAPAETSGEGKGETPEKGKGKTLGEGKEETTQIPSGEVDGEHEGADDTTAKALEGLDIDGIDIDDIFGGGLPGGYGQVATEDTLEEVTVVPVAGGLSTTQKSEALASGQEEEVTEESIIILPSTKSPPLDCSRNE